MSKKILNKIILTWFLFVPLAILNGIVRESVYQQYTGELLAHQISTIIACLAFYLLAFIMLRKKIVDLGNKKLLLIGLLWISMTIVFEFGFGHYVAGHSWSKLLADYNIFQGRVWSLFLVFVLFTPLLIKKNN